MLSKLKTRLQLFSHTKVGVSVLICVGAGIMLCSFWFPYWVLNLNAPQYPNGLNLSVYMDHVEGDVAEVNILNHYIGMANLNDAAQFERRIAWPALLLLVLGATIAIPIGRKAYIGRKIYKALYLPPLFFLLGFMADLFYWLYKAGHDLNPDAPVTITPFTPTMLGSGKIGQFSTVAYFGWGFWLAVAGILVIFYALGKKKTICQGCEDYQNCQFICNRPASWVNEWKS